jgi:hypothetical protein
MDSKTLDKKLVHMEALLMTLGIKFDKRKEILNDETLRLDAASWGEDEDG